MLPEAATILLVDDSADDRFLLRRCWAKAGIPNPLVELEDGQQAIDHLAATSARDMPALVLLDLKMPLRNGFEVLAWMRAHEPCMRVPVIVMTASDQPGDVEEVYALGANSFLVKPSSVEELIELLLAVKAFWLRFNVYPGR